MTHIDIYNKWKTENPEEYSSMDDAQKRAKMMQFKRQYMATTGSAERNISRAKQMFPDDKLIPAMEKGPEAFQEELKYQSIPQTTRSMYPRISRSMARGESFNPVAGVADAASGLGRLAETASYKGLGGEQPFSERMEMTEGRGFLGDAIASPYNMMPTTRVGGGLASLAKAPLQKAGAHFTKGVAESLPSALSEQALRIDEGKDPSLGEFGAEVIAGGLLPVGGKAAKTVLFGKKGELNKYTAAELSKDLLSSLSGKSKELLDYVGGDELKTGIKRLVKSDVPDTEKISKIKDFGTRAEEITSEVVEYLDNGVKDRFIDFNPRVKTALNEMGDIDISDIVLDLNKKKKAVLDPRDPLASSSGLVPRGHSTGDESIDVVLNNYDNVIDKLTGRLYGDQRFTIPASELYDIRKSIDKTINFDKNKFNKGLQKDLYNIPVDARMKIAEKLKKAGAKTSFPDDMAEAHELFNLRDEITRKIGDGQNLDKTKRFLISLGNPNKIENRILAKKVEKLMGKEAFEKANILRLSREYADVLGVYNDIGTGRSMLGTTLGGALGGVAGAAGEKIGKATGAIFGSPLVSAPTYGAINAAQESFDLYTPRMRKLMESNKKLMRSGLTENIGE